MTYFSCIFQIIKTLMITITDESMLYKELIEWKTAIIVSEKEYTITSIKNYQITMTKTVMD